MAIQQIQPYIHFNGTAEEAIRFYERALGARVEALMRMSEMPPGACGDAEFRIPAGYENKIMHSHLRIGGSEIMISDSMPGQPSPQESNVQIALQFSDAADLARTFQAMSEGSQVIMAPMDAFWGAKFGLLRDRFGVTWMFNAPAAATA